jgi:hypothetical protein
MNISLIKALLSKGLAGVATYIKDISRKCTFLIDFVNGTG